MVVLFVYVIGSMVTLFGGNCTSNSEYNLPTNGRL